MTGGLSSALGQLAKEGAINLAKRKMRGQQLKDALHFLLYPARSPEHVAQFVKRLESLPDLDIDPADREFVSGITKAERLAMRDERAGGMTIKQVAEKHRVSMATVCRHTAVK